jgi:hypothetical protein
MLRQCLNKFRQVELYIKIVDMVEPIVPDIVAAAGDNDIEPKLLGHGDPWAHNVMLRRDPETGVVNGVAFVDFGNVRMVHPLEDLFCFVGTSSVRQAVIHRDTKIPSLYKDRLYHQLPQDFVVEKCNAPNGLLSRRSAMHARAALLVYFFDNEVWWQRNAKGQTEPGERQIAAFASIAKLAQQSNAEREIEHLPPAFTQGLEQTEQNCIKRK